MARNKRNIGLEILEGLQELKRGEHGRKTVVPSILGIRGIAGASRLCRREISVCRRHLAGTATGRIPADTTVPASFNSIRKFIVVPLENVTLKTSLPDTSALTKVTLAMAPSGCRRACAAASCARMVAARRSPILL